MPSSQVEKIINMIWLHAESDFSLQFYAILDTAREEAIYHKLADSDIECVSLFRGEKARELATVAPYLMALQRDDSFTQWIINSGWGQSWGIIVGSRATLNELKRHFRNFLMVYDEDGKPLFFRYYDPRVLRVYLPTCNESEIETVFGPVSQYWVEGQDGKSMLEYSQAYGKLSERNIQLEID
jgi:hypothetical protein